VFARYEQRIAEDPSDPGGYRLLSFACLRAGDRDTADRTIRAGLLVAPGDPTLIEQQGDLYAATGRPEDALASWRRAFALAPEEYGSACASAQRSCWNAWAASPRPPTSGSSSPAGRSSAGKPSTSTGPRRELRRLEAELAGG